MSYVYVCDCRKDPSAPLIPAARAEVDSPTGRHDTLGRNNAFFRCTRHDNPRLNRICLHRPHRFQKVATRVMHHCTKTTLTPREMMQNGPFRFSTRRCEIIFITSFVPQTAALSICKCEIMPNVNVVVGRGIAFTARAPIDPVVESKIIKRCIASTRAQLTDVCLNVPGDFEILSLHILQTCCKRARRLSNSKLDCAAIVPDDLSGLKVELGTLA